MQRLLGRYSEFLYTALRIVVGCTFACHGAQKLFGFFGGVDPRHPGTAVALFSLMGLAGVIEFFGGLSMALGILFPYAPFLASGEMATAYFLVHARQAVAPLVNHGELAVVYCFLFLFFATHGPGRWSLSAAFRSKPTNLPTRQET
jgi:putative oxidoreductase